MLMNINVESEAVDLPPPETEKMWEFEIDLEYLGSTIVSSHGTSAEIQKQIAADNRGLYGLVRIFRSKELQRSTKVKAYETLLKPAVLYESEA